MWLILMKISTELKKVCYLFSSPLNLSTNVKFLFIHQYVHTEIDKSSVSKCVGLVTNDNIS